MKAVISIDLDGPSFSGDLAAELARILYDLASNIDQEERPKRSRQLHDSDNNVVGTYEVAES